MPGYRTTIRMPAQQTGKRKCRKCISLLRCSSGPPGGGEYILMTAADCTDFADPGAPLPALLRHDVLPVLHQILGRAPCERLKRQCGISRSARAHNGSSEIPEIGRFVREPPCVDDIGLA